jgi:hypothetical protein
VQRPFKFHSILWVLGGTVVALVLALGITVAIQQCNGRRLEVEIERSKELQTILNGISFIFQGRLMTPKYAINMCRRKQAERFCRWLVMAGLFLGCLSSCNRASSGNLGTENGNSSEASTKETPMSTEDHRTETSVPLAPIGKEFSYNFDADSPGQLPAGLHAARTGAGKDSRWSIINDPTAPTKPNAVAQTSVDQIDYRFPLLIADAASFRDLDLTVKFKAVSGSIDRAGGLAFRLRDTNNYYVVRANALENNYNLYRVVNGRRSEFAGAKFKVTSGEWHELRVEVVGSKITCYYDGNEKINVGNETFKDAGKIGLWTKADSVTYFDDLRVKAR